MLYDLPLPDGTVVHLNKMQMTEKYLTKIYPDLVRVVRSLPPTDFREALYWWAHDIKEYPRCTCGNIPAFINYNQGYRVFCSKTCSNRDKNTQAKSRETCLAKYGVEHPAQAPEIRRKVRETCLERYGVEHQSQCPEVRQKVVNTCLERYGTTSPLGAPEIRKQIAETNEKLYGGIGFASPELLTKAQDTMEERLGVRCCMSSPEVQEKVRKTNEIRYGGTGVASPILRDKYFETRRSNLIDSLGGIMVGYDEDGNWICPCPRPGQCDKCAEKTYVIPSSIYRDRERDHTEPCTHILPVSRSNSSSTTPEIRVRDILDNLSVHYETNVRGIIGAQELDIYLPDHRVAFEVNGIYWHSDHNKVDSYHKDKTTKAEEAGIRLYHIWEDWLVTKPDIVESMITNWLGCTPNKIGARKCLVREVDSTTAQDFLRYNHIQGSCPTTIRIGLYHNNKLISLMTFSGRGDNVTLSRFCSLRGWSVVGGASRLLKYYIKTYKPRHVVSFSARDISAGNLYKTLGFTKSPTITNSYWYINPVTMERFHRSSFSKSAIVARGWKDRIDSSWTERDVMAEHKFLRICDSGIIRWDLEVI